MAKISKHGGSGGPEAGQRLLKVRVRSAKKRTLASRRWLERQLNDPYVVSAKREGLRSRAAYKLMELDDKLKFLKPGQRVVDLGAAPGGWAQVTAERVHATPALGERGQVVAIDISEMEALPGVEILHLDFMAAEAPARLIALLRGAKADVVLSDMAAPSSGHARTDHIRIMGLAEVAGVFAAEVLAPGGTFVAKVLQGGTEKELLNQLKRDFTTVRHVKPPASRADSAELYVVATGFRGGSG
jgi:23S rRNA (uridine2552-2'-O)-methyltransferase